MTAFWSEMLTEVAGDKFPVRSVYKLCKREKESEYVWSENVCGLQEYHWILQTVRFILYLFVIFFNKYFWGSVFPGVYIS